MNEITRFRDTVSITAGSSVASTTQRFAFAPYAGGCVIVAATGGGTQINWYGSHSQEATPLQIFADGSAVTTALTVGIVPVPDACFALPFVAPVVAGATTCSMTISLKG